MLKSVGCNKDKSRVLWRGRCFIFRERLFPMEARKWIGMQRKNLGSTVFVRVTRWRSWLRH